MFFLLAQPLEARFAPLGSVKLGISLSKLTGLCNTILKHCHYTDKLITEINAYNYQNNTADLLSPLFRLLEGHFKSFMPKA